MPDATLFYSELGHQIRMKIDLALNQLIDNFLFDIGSHGIHCGPTGNCITLLTSSFSSSPSLPSFPAARFCAANCSSTRARRSCSCDPGGMIGCGGGDGAEGPPPRLGRLRRRFGVEIPVEADPRLTLGLKIT